MEFFIDLLENQFLKLEFDINFNSVIVSKGKPIKKGQIFYNIGVRI